MLFGSIRGAALLALTHAGLAVQHPSRSRDDGSFENPASRDRPRFRYWLPDGSVNPQTVKDDIAASGRIGAGGVEFVPFFEYGGMLGGPPPGVDWAGSYGFGSPAYLEVMRAALEAHDENNLAMDFALGPSEGQGVPAFPDNEGLQWELITHDVAIPRDGLFNGTLPGWPKGTLVAAVSAYVASSKNVTFIGGYREVKEMVTEELTLRNHTLTDLTSRVDLSTGHLHAEFPRPCGHGTFRIFAFYERLTGHRSLDFESNGTSTIWDYGAFAVDHFSARGAKVTTDFWDEHILSDSGIREQLRKVANYGWEDSLELMSTMSWSPTLPQRFLDKFGYNMRHYLPLFVWGNNNLMIQSGVPGDLRAFLDTPDAGAGFLNDYRAALADGYVEYLMEIRTWLRDALDIQMSAQVAYNMPLDMLAVVHTVDAPESESLQGQNNVDAYRNFAGPATLAGRNIISNELGAAFGRGTSFPISELLQMANRCFSGGVNQLVIHGQSYSGDYPATTWPGHAPFRYHVADLYSHKRPDWDHGLKQALEYLGRLQYVQRQGVARTDIAVYKKQTTTDPILATIFEVDSLESHGWSFNYLTAENLDLKQAVVVDKILSPDGPAYKAVLLPGTSNLTVAALQRLQQYADAGLPILFTGQELGHYPMGSASERYQVLAAADALLASENVYTVDDSDVPELLVRLGLRPRVGVITNGLWYTTWREDAEAGIGYAYVFADDLAGTTGDLVVRSTKTPYILDPWTGSRSQLLHYKVEDGQTTIPLRLASHQTAVFAFLDEPVSQDQSLLWFHDIPTGTLRVGRDVTRGLYADLPRNISGSATLSSGETVALTSSAAAASWALGNWTLVAEHWEAPDDFYEASVIAVKRNTTHHLDDLVSWLEIPALANVSGIGHYTTHFEWDSSSLGVDVGAYVHFPPVLGALSVRINGKDVGSMDYTAPVADISPHLVNGTNEITATVPTTMWNYLRTMIYDIRSVGNSPVPVLMGTIPPQTDNGLIGSVRIVPFERVYVG